jgi:hypothetical protein
LTSLIESLPRDAGEERGGGIESFGCAQDRLREAIEQLERFDLGFAESGLLAQGPRFNCGIRPVLDRQAAGGSLAAIVPLARHPKRR